MRIPDHFSRADIGAYMRELRQHYSLSEQDVSERLHIRAKYITAMEAANFDVMPGRAYARGYLQTYAEFLGLDAEQVVEHCFGTEPVRPPVERAAPSHAPGPRAAFPFWGYGVIALAGLLALLVALQHKPAAPDQETVAVQAVPDVPEDYLEGLRTLSMPLAEGYECLRSAGLLACIHAHPSYRALAPKPVPDMSPAGHFDAPEKTGEEPTPDDAVEAPPEEGREP
jgi:hypothetical protein